MYMSNHQSSLDMFIYGAFIPRGTVVVAKRSIKYMPLLGQYLALAGTIYIDRLNHDSAMQGMQRAAAEIVQRKVSVIIFPEGTRSRTAGELLPFKKGGFNLAVEAKVPIVPLIVSQLQPVYDPKARRFLPGTITVKGAAAASYGGNAAPSCAGGTNVASFHPSIPPPLLLRTQCSSPWRPTCSRATTCPSLRRTCARR